MTDSGRTYEEVNVDVNNPILTGILAQGANAEAESDANFDKTINSADAEFGRQTAAVDTWEKTQTELQNEQNEFAIEKINQQKDWAKQDYIKEQSGAWTDYQKQTAKHGVNAEIMAARGLANTGYSESSLVSMYNAYQNRVATARESFNRAVVEYDNMITEARLQNNAALAEIANNALQKRLEISMNAFQYKNTLLLEKAKAKREINQNYWARYSDMYGKIQDQEQFNAQMAETARHNKVVEDLQKKELIRQQAKDAWERHLQKQAAKNSNNSGGGGTSGGSGGGSGGSGKISKNGKPISTSKDSNQAPKLSPKLVNENPTVDMNSVLALGYGPISESKLAKLIAGGDVTKYVENGKIKFKKTYETAGLGSAGKLVRRFE